MKYERIGVSCRDDYKGAQEPRSFAWRGECFEIRQVLDRWYEGGLDSRRMPMRYYRVEVSGGKRYILRYHEMFDAWSIGAAREEAT